MALLEYTRSMGPPATVVDRAFAAMTNSIAALVVWNDARRTRNTLSQLSAHELDDIGLCRGDIDEIAHKTY